MLEKIIVAALVALAGAYLARRFLRGRTRGGCGCSGSSSGGGCCQELGPMPKSGATPGGAGSGGSGCGGACGCSRGS
ncbi:hypothetical protein NNJEOMEG_01613 [Fundidesulfovibrio magnetotacticus]|uniref:FeoB-associated Cys-rich membrane protein n=1 Tax=Fundidesulfovibrio magnetotacticus TaxID=2730080 RepID=A0A6V8LUI9_9BACT|nr:FeoB-associated Cys-rich membrane protein [Fundidesulfovibrio magnetotacticus]GFK93779.1 hypothetical protein NNJEOMEG_01613 [Fundidesulfovibrio magnetotacticus]